MNYFEFYVGDYARDTAHLTLVEHGAFLMLLAAYYGTEKPLAPDSASLHRIARAMTPAEQGAVNAIADQFFPIAADGMRHNARADDLIAKARQRIDAARSNGQKGGRPSKPSKNPPGNPLGSDPLTQPLTQQQSQTKAHQTPYTKEQKHSGGSADADHPESRAKAIPYDAILAAYNSSMTKLAKAREVNGDRRAAIRREWQVSPQRQSLAFWQAYFAECQDDDFLNGTGPYREQNKNWRPDFDYLLKAKVVTKVFERAMDRMEREGE